MDITDRLARVEWNRISAELEDRGWALTGQLLTLAEREELIRSYSDDARYRSTVVMGRHGYWGGEYRYFAYPLPDLVAGLRGALYERLVPLANWWRKGLGLGDAFPDSDADYLGRCYAAGQTRPTPLILRYGPGDYNCLHQDLYGDLAFPMQAAFLLSGPGTDFTGGEFVLTEQRPRMQSRVNVVPLQAGEAVTFAVNHRPVQGSRGTYRVTMRHGVSPVLTGSRHTLGIFLHHAA